jgi:TRAP-type C4-dicarboxylate transport system permease small subunit
MADKLVAGIRRLLEWVLIGLLAGMAGMVLLNVVLRYGFNSGITFSEEMARYFFVWLTFIGAVLTFGEHGHIGVETLVRRFGRRGRVACMALSNAIILLCAGVFLWGTWLQHDINASMTAAVVEMSMVWVFGVGYVSGLGIGAIAALRLWRNLTGTTSDVEVAQFAGEWGEGAVVNKGGE